MLSRYKVIISSRNIYKEVELLPELSQLKIGTDTNCEVRLRKEVFFEKIEVTFVQNNGIWNIVCSDNLYLDAGDVRKLLTKQLVHGDTFEIKYQESNMEVFSLFFTLDFEYEKKFYDTEVDISGKQQVVIGGDPNADIHINDENIGNDNLVMQRQNGCLIIFDANSRYGVCVNGTRINGQKAIQDYDFFSIANYSFYYKNNRLYTTVNQNVRLKGLVDQPMEKQTTHFEYPNFIRNNRVQYCIPEDEIEIQQPKPKPQKTKKNLLLSLIPSVFMLVLMIVMRGILGNGGTFVIYSVCSMGIGVVMSIVTYRVDGKENQQAIEQREKEYLEYIQKKENEIVESRNNELRIRNLIYTSLTNSINEVLGYGKRIFEKSDQDKDFLDIYLGTGVLESTVPIKYTKQEFIDTEDPISLLPETTEKKYHYLQNAPIVSKFNSSSAVGVVGTKDMLRSVLKNITLDLAIRHFYKEVKMYYMFDENEKASMQWMKWLRHVYNDDIGIRNFMCDDESRKVLLENLYAVLSARETAKKENEGLTFDTYYVIFVLDATTIRNHPVSKYIEDGSKYGFTFVFFEEYEEFLPKGCTEVIRLDNSSLTGTLLESANGDVQTKFAFQNINDNLAEKVALKLGAVTVKEVSLESELTKNISMYQLLNIFSVDDLDLKQRWDKAEVYKSMAAPLGVKTKDEVVYLDISDKANAHGPHGLVAGTTGSGKSEILQTYVLSMATLYHPYDVGFVIIDFKGGGMANQFKDLPHMMGAITNIDGREINRSLLSIKAELVKRQALFAQAGVNHVNDYIKLFKKGEVKQPLPHLIIIVDEFAELKAEFPDFMKELISAARIGRTLGVHLILATQKPAGVVDSQIWSNSKFKLCLKVQTKEDSNEVIKTPLAAEIVEPGRAYFQVGNNEIFELFQSAYSGVKVTSDGDDKARVFSIYSLNEWGKRTMVYTNKKKGSSDDAKNQLQVIVDYVHDYCKAEGIKTLNGICLPSLADVIRRDELLPFEKKANENIVVPVGIYDDPERQDQGNYCIDLSENNTYIIGSAMTGKTTMLQTILLQLMNHYTPNDVNVFIIDCGNMTLKAFENSKLVGGVAIATEEDKVVNLFKMLFRVMEERKKVFSEKGLGTHKAYLEAGYTDMPQIVLMIDNLAAFKEYYDNLSDDFLALSREATSLGLSIIATANQTNAMNYKALANYATRIALVCNDTNEYMNIFERCRMEPKDVPGRGLCVIDKRILEFQTALCVNGDKEYIRVENIKKAIANSNNSYGAKSAMQIPVVPDIIRFSDIKDTDIYKSSYQIPMGIDYSNVQYQMIDLRTLGLLVTTGREQFGKTNFLKYVFAAINANLFGSLTEAYVIDSAERTLSALDKYGFVEKYTTDIADLEGIVEHIETTLQQRQENTSMDEEYNLDEEPFILLAIENPKWVDVIQANKELSTKIVQLIKQYKKYKFAMILSEVENMAVSFSAPELLKFAKENKKFVVFDDISNVKLFDVTVKQSKEHAKPLDLGDAFVYINGNIQRIKTVLLEEGE